MTRALNILFQIWDTDYVDKLAFFHAVQSTQRGNYENLFLKNWMQFFSTKLHYLSTVWKFHDFSITQILREIKFGELELLEC